MQTREQRLARLKEVPSNSAPAPNTTPPASPPSMSIDPTVALRSAQLQIRIAELEAQLKAATDRADTAERLQDRLRDDCLALQQQLHQQGVQIGELRGQLNAKPTDITVLESQIARLMQDLDEARSEARQTGEDLRSERERFQNVIGLARAAQTEAEEALLRVGDDRDRTQSSVMELQQALSALTVLKEAADSELKTLQSKHMQAVALQTRLNEELESATQQTKQLEEQLQLMCQELCNEQEARAAALEQSILLQERIVSQQFDFTELLSLLNGEHERLERRERAAYGERHERPILAFRLSQLSKESRSDPERLRTFGVPETCLQRLVTQLIKLGLAAK